MFKFDRKFYTPSGYHLIAKDERYGFEVWGQLQPKVVALAFGGKRQKPDWHFRFADQSRLQAKIEETLRGYMQHETRKREQSAKRHAPHDVKPGDIFRCTWGYDQTNVEFFECTKVLSASYIEVCAIAADSEDTAFMQGNCVPMRGTYCGEPMRKKVSMASGEPAIAIHSFANAYRMKPVAVVAGAPIYQSSHWTAYA